MANLDKERSSPQYGAAPVPDFLDLPVAASSKLQAGGLVGTTGGYAVRGAATATKGIEIVGRAEKTADNTSGSNGDIRVRVRQGVFRFNNSSAGDAITEAHIGQICFCVDDQTAALTSNSGARARLGRIIKVDSDGVYVQLGIGIAGPHIQMFIATLVGGTVTISGVKLTADSNIQVSRKTSGGTAGHLACPSASRDAAAGTIVVSSSSGTDTSTLDVLVVG